MLRCRSFKARPAISHAPERIRRVPALPGAGRGYRSGAGGGPAFIESSAPAGEELRALQQTVVARLTKMITRPGMLAEDMGRIWLAEPDVDGEEARTLQPLRPLRPLQAAALTCRIAFGPSRAGQEVLTLRGAVPRECAARQPPCADIDGFSSHAAVRVEANDRRRLEQLCRYITRPAPSGERAHLNDARQVEFVRWNSSSRYHGVMERPTSC